MEYIIHFKRGYQFFLFIGWLSVCYMFIGERTTLYLKGSLGSDCKTEIVQGFTDQIQKPKPSKKVKTTKYDKITTKLSTKIVYFNIMP